MATADTFFLVMIVWEAGRVAIRTSFTELFQIDHPLVLAPMGGASGGALAAAVSEAGGHGSRRATLPLVPAVADAVAPVPVLAAGGIADGRGVAAALMLGAQGAVLGTRFGASSEALWPDWAKKCW